MNVDQPFSLGALFGGASVTKKPRSGRLPQGPAWLVVIDPQMIFADESSPWAAPLFAEAMSVITNIAPRFGDRVLVTRWLPADVKTGSWRAYFKRWPFADRPPGDALFDLVPAAANLSPFPTVDLPTFGKWGPKLQTLLGPTPNLVLTGCAADCCVISTALAAADDGAAVRVVSDACAGSSDENHTAALHIMGLYDPQIRVITSAEIK